MSPFGGGWGRTVLNLSVQAILIILVIFRCHCRHITYYIYAQNIPSFPDDPAGFCFWSK